MPDQLPTVRAAVVQAAPEFLDREATTQKACSLIREAGRRGAEIVVFPEGYIPCHPVWYHFLPASQPAAVSLAADLFRNAVVVGGPVTLALGAAARDAGCWVVMGVCEKRAGTTGTMWNSIVYLSPDGEVVRVHRKTAPTTVERLVHTGGSGSGLEAVGTPFGPITGLLCGENSNPLLVFSALAQSTVIHAAMWPHHFSRKTDPVMTMPDVIINNARSLAYQMGSYILSAGGTLGEGVAERIATTDVDRAWLRERQDFGGSCIVAPNGKVLAGPLGPEEDVLVADLDLERILPKKLMHDFAGHYTREDLFSVRIEPDPAPLFDPPWDGALTRPSSAPSDDVTEPSAARPTTPETASAPPAVEVGGNGFAHAIPDVGAPAVSNDPPIDL